MLLLTETHVLYYLKSIMLPLIISPAKILRQKAKAITIPAKVEIIELAKNMAAAMTHYKGIGLAGPQVNKGIRIICIATAKGPSVYINPTIKKSSILKSVMEEGCLSIPGVFGLVKRSKKVYVSHYTVAGNEETLWLEGLMARVYQHEVDHLNGILFTDIAIEITGGEELLEKYGLAK